MSDRTASIVTSHKLTDTRRLSSSCWLTPPRCVWDATMTTTTAMMVMMTMAKNDRADDQNDPFYYRGHAWCVIAKGLLYSVINIRPHNARPRSKNRETIMVEIRRHMGLYVSTVFKNRHCRWCVNDTVADRIHSFHSWIMLQWPTLFVYLFPSFISIPIPSSCVTASV